VTTFFNDTGHTASKGRKSVNYELEEMWNAGQCHSQQLSRGTEWNPRTREYKHSIAKHSNATFDVEWEIENKSYCFPVRLNTCTRRYRAPPLISNFVNTTAHAQTNINLLVLCGRETWSHILRGKHTLWVYDNKILRK
jgi:hypothetical protein